MNPSLHPFQPDYSNLSNDELDIKQADLIHRLTIVRRMNLDIGMENKLFMLLDGLDAEREKRRRQEDTDSGVWLETDPLPKPPSKDQR